MSNRHLVKRRPLRGILRDVAIGQVSRDKTKTARIDMPRIEMPATIPSDASASEVQVDTPLPGPHRPVIVSLSTSSVPTPVQG